MAAAILALVGALLGAGVALSVELVRSRTEYRVRSQDAVRQAAADFAGALVSMRYIAHDLPTHGADRAAGMSKLRLQDESAVMHYERLRLLVNSLDAQREARLALRHAWALWQQAVTGIDPRASEYVETPLDRLDEALRRMQIEVRRELNLRSPDDVLPEPSS